MSDIGTAIVISAIGGMFVYLTVNDRPVEDFQILMVIGVGWGVYSAITSVLKGL